MNKTLRSKINFYLPMLIWMLAGAFPGFSMAIIGARVLFPHFQNNPTAAAVCAVFILTSAVAGVLGIILGVIAGLLSLIYTKNLTDQQNNANRQPIPNAQPIPD
jgi:hypothetical protein